MEDREIQKLQRDFRIKLAKALNKSDINEISNFFAYLEGYIDTLVDEDGKFQNLMIKAMNQTAIQDAFNTPELEE